MKSLHLSQISNRLDLTRTFARWKRRVRGAKPTVHYYHQTDDPYSDLASRALPHLKANFDVELIPHIVPPPEPAAAPEAKKLSEWSLQDGVGLAIGLGFHPLPWEKAPAPALVQRAESALATTNDPVVFAEKCADIGLAFRTGDNGDLPPGGGDRKSALRAGEKLRRKQGHYLGATFYFEGEWFWGLDRLDHLEARLAPFAKAGRPPELFTLRRDVTNEPGVLNRTPRLDFFLSLQCPYCYLALPRVMELVETYNARLFFRFVLPMSMRGLFVPPVKHSYLSLDSKREAERLGLPYTFYKTQNERSAERGLAILHQVNGTPRAAEFVQSYLRGVFVDGLNGASEKGLTEMCERSGISVDEMRFGLEDETWRAEADQNRQDLLELGLWGVPSFRVDDGPAIWGQDRLWLVEEDLRAAAALEELRDAG